MGFLFHFSAITVVPFWLAMIFFPHKELTKKMVSSPWIILPPVICYALLLLPNVSTELFSFFAEPSPNGLAEIMKEPWASSMYWAYAGAFDLFVGRWIFFDSRTSSISHWIVAPILALSIFFGPIGFLGYGLVKLISRR